MKVIPLFISLLAISLAACEGERCAATESPLEDVDADCVEDSSDNCPLDANPGQIDADSDGVGSACDADDSDDTVALYKYIPVDHKELDTDWIGTYSLVESDCDDMPDSLTLSHNVFVWNGSDLELTAVDLPRSLSGLMSLDEPVYLARDGKTIKIIDRSEGDVACSSYYELVY